MAVLIEATVSFSVVFSASPVICFVVGSSWLFIAFAKDIANEMPTLNVEDSIENENQKDANESLCEIIQLYTEVKQLSENLIHDSFYELSGSNSMDFIYSY